MKSSALSIIPIFLIITLTAFSSFAQVNTDFEEGLDGWTAVGDGQFYLEEGTGNPGNVMRIDDDATGNILYAIAPRHYLGDWSHATSEDSLYYDLFLNRISGSFINTQRIFSISGPGGRAWGLMGSAYNPPDKQWKRYVISLNPDDWTMQSGNWDDLIKNVTLLELTAEFISGPEFVRLDNIGMTFSPEINNVRANVHSTFDNSSFEGWFFVDAGPVTIQSTGGNPDGYLRIGDRSGVLSKAVAPPAYLGDWTEIDGNAALNFDINIISHSGTLLDLEYFVRISGPGGTARVDLPPDITDAFALWKTFSFFISEEDWILEEGTWDALMQRVDELIILVEFINGNEVIGLDNVMITNDPPDVDFHLTRTFLFPGDSLQLIDRTRLAPNEWQWDFGDGNTSSEQNPWHTWESSGIFDVGLEASNRFGTSSLVRPSAVEVAGITDSLLFADDFDEGTIHPAWDFRGNCNWSIQNGTLAQTSNYHVPGNLLGACYGITGSRYWDDYLLDVDFRSTDDDGIGAVFRYVDENNFYLFYWREEVEHRALKKFVDGVETDLIADTARYDINRWYNLKIEATGPEITVWLDDEVLYEVTDSTFEAGKAGVYCWANQSSFWDNFQVVRTNMEPDPPSITFANIENGTTAVEQRFGDAWAFGLVEIPGVTDGTEPSDDIRAWIGYSQQDGDPAELDQLYWEEAEFDADYDGLGDGRHRYMYNLGGLVMYTGKQAPPHYGSQLAGDAGNRRSTGSQHPHPGTGVRNAEYKKSHTSLKAPPPYGIQSDGDLWYYYFFRFQYLDQEYVYGGYSPDGGGFWDGEENVSGRFFVLDVSTEPEPGLPREFALQQNYPNPFNPSTRIAFSLPRQEHVRLEVYDVLGRRVALLIDEVRPAGLHSVDFDAGPLGSGTYLYRISAGEFTQSAQMMLLK